MLPGHLWGGPYVHLVKELQKDPERKPLPQICFGPQVKGGADVRSPVVLLGRWFPSGGLRGTGQVWTYTSRHCRQVHRQVSPFSDHLLFDSLVCSDLTVCKN